MLVGPRVNHHVPRVPVQSISPVVVALQRCDVRKFYYIGEKKINFLEFSVWIEGQQDVPV